MDGTVTEANPQHLHLCAGGFVLSYVLVGSILLRDALQVVLAFSFFDLRVILQVEVRSCPAVTQVKHLQFAVIDGSGVGSERSSRRKVYIWKGSHLVIHVQSLAVIGVHNPSRSLRVVHDNCAIGEIFTVPNPVAFFDFAHAVCLLSSRYMPSL